MGARPRAANWALGLLALPFSVPTVSAALVGIQWLGGGGLLARWGFPGLAPEGLGYGFAAVVTMHVLLNAPWIGFLVARARARVPERELEAARLLGAGWGARLRWVVLPRVLWPALAATVQVFALCSMSFSLVLLLGGGPPVETLETAIYARVRSSLLDVGGASAAAVWQLLLTAVPWAVVVALSLRFGRAGPPGSSGGGVESAGAPRGLFWGGGAVFNAKSLAALACALPFLVLPLSASWETLLRADVLWVLLPPLALSLRIAFEVAVLSLVLGAAAALTASRDGKLASILFALPSGISVLVLGLGFWLAYGAWVDPFEGSRLAMVTLQAALFFPLVFRTLWPLTLDSRRAALEAALVLGASPFRAWLAVEWPRWKPTVLGLAAVVAAGSLGEVAAVSLFYSESLVPLPLLAQRWAGQYRFEEARAVGALLLALSATTVLLVRPHRESTSFEK
jgi:thiamine transport system permease protein